LSEQAGYSLINETFEIEEQNMKLTLIALGLAASTAAFASTPTYKCGTSPDADNVKSPVLLTLNNDGSIAVNNNGVSRNMERSNEEAPAGYTAFTGTMGCSQHPGGAAQCGAISLSTLYVAYPMVAGTPQGKAVLNGQDLYCAMQMMD
jgi:hypothetical protein